MMAHDVGLCTEVLDIYNAAVFRWLRRKAKAELGLVRVSQAHPAAVTVVHRGSSHLALNVHFHSLAADGVYLHGATATDAAPEFRALPAPSCGEVTSVAWETCEKTMKILRDRGQWIDMDPNDDRFARAEPGLAQCYASSIAGILTLGPHAGQRVVRFGARASSADNEEQQPSAGQTVVPGFGFSVHAGRRISADDRSGLERVARYVLRPAIAQDRLKLLPGGKVQWELKRRWNDGTSHFVFEPLDFLSKLAALIFPPKMHRIRYFGCWARRAKLRPLVSPHADCEPASCSHADKVHADQVLQQKQGNGFKRPRYDWATLLARCWSVDVLECGRCHSRMQRIAWITKAEAIRKIVQAVGLPADWPQPAPSRWARQEELFAAA